MSKLRSTLLQAKKDMDKHFKIKEMRVLRCSKNKNAGEADKRKQNSELVALFLHRGHVNITLCPSPVFKTILIVYSIKVICQIHVQTMGWQL